MVVYVLAKKLASYNGASGLQPLHHTALHYWLDKRKKIEGLMLVLCELAKEQKKLVFLHRAAALLFTIAPNVWFGRFCQIPVCVSSLDQKKDLSLVVLVNV